jgi:hypothetical protein
MTEQDLLLLEEGMEPCLLPLLSLCHHHHKQLPLQLK